MNHMHGGKTHDELLRIIDLQAKVIRVLEDSAGRCIECGKPATCCDECHARGLVRADHEAVALPESGGNA